MHAKNLLKLLALITLNLGLFECKSIYVTNNTITWDFGSYIKLPNDSVKFSLQFFAPTKPGTYQVIAFFPGFDGIAPEFIYTDFSNRLVSESNSIVVAFNKFSIIHLPENEEILYELTLNWTLANLDSLLNSNTTPALIRGLVKTDLKTNGVTIMSHSSSGHIVSMYLVRTCGLARSLVLLDPVDGYDPFGIVKDFVTHPPNKLPFQIPTLIVATGLSSARANPLFVSCAPSNNSNERFYNSLDGPTWYMNFTDYGHADILDDWVRICCSRLLCKMCVKKCDFLSYRKNLVVAITTFLKAIHEKNFKYLDAIQNPMKSGIFDLNMNIEAFYDQHGFDVITSGAFCKHS